MDEQGGVVDLEFSETDDEELPAVRVRWEPFEILGYAGAAMVTALAVLQSLSAVVTYLLSRSTGHNPFGGAGGAATFGAHQLLAGTSWSDTAAVLLVVTVALGWAAACRWSPGARTGLPISENDAWDGESDESIADESAFFDDEDADENPLSEDAGDRWQNDAEVGRHLARADALAIWAEVLLAVTLLAAVLRIFASFWVPHPLTARYLATTLLYEFQPLLVALIAAGSGVMVTRRIRALGSQRWSS